ncbi:MAG: NAD(P)H-dependent oxidoreductase [Alphaproteobacteria bacterium GM7ARS4]|nr:NAD(P)H-dependent oxidoreductase [Alphaproteobacteria bacterium GM7ARS4]
MKALFLNCSLKKSDEESNTQALCAYAQRIFEKESVTCEHIRVVDYYIPFGMKERVDSKDDWPSLFAKVMASQILIIGTPIWFGEKSSVASLVIERLYAFSAEKNDVGQYIYYNKVAGVIATGNEDGGKESCRSVLYALQHMGFTIPPQADAYWVGEAGPGPSYIEEGQDNAFTQRNTQFLTYNLLHVARMLDKQPIPAIGNVRLETSS